MVIEASQSSVVMVTGAGHSSYVIIIQAIHSSRLNPDYAIAIQGSYYIIR